MTINLDDRLLQVASFINDGQIVYDVGSDHGFLPIYLVTYKNCPYVVAVENKFFPFQRLEKNVFPFPNIKPILADGLAMLTADIHVISMAGIGGQTMINIVRNYLETHGDDLTQEFVIEPQSDYYAVRDYFNSIGYMIVQEVYVKERRKYYPVIHYVKGKEELDLIEKHFGKRALENQDRFLKEMLEHNIEVLSSLEIDKVEDKLEIYKEGLKRWIK